MRHLKPYAVLSLGVLALASMVAGCSAPPSTQEQAEASAPEQAPASAGETAQESAYTAPAAVAEAPRASVRQASEPRTQAPAVAPVTGMAGRATTQPAVAPAEPEPRSEPEPVVVTLPAGTVVDVAFLDSLSSKESQVGDSFRARVTQDVMHDGIPVIPAGSVVRGTVTEAVPLNPKIGGKAKLALEFSKIELTSGRTAPINAAFAQAGKSESKKDAATIGGAAAGGAVLGRLLKKHDKDKGMVLGAIVGAAAGTAIAAKTEGEEVLIPSGAEISLQLNEPAHISVRL